MGPVPVGFTATARTVLVLAVARISLFWCCVIVVIVSFLEDVGKEGAFISSIGKAASEKNLHLAWAR